MNVRDLRSADTNTNLHDKNSKKNVSEVSSVYLRGHVIRSPTKSVRCLVQVNLKLAHPKVHQSDVALVVKQEVVQLQVPDSEYLI